MVRGKLVFISGGVRSGKSRYAEQLLTNGQGRLLYIASGQATDEEMRKRIHQHQQDRATFHWETIEQPTNLEKALPFIKDGDCVLWDCMTTWLANELYEGWEEGMPCIERPNCMEVKVERLSETIDEITKRTNTFIIVSNEVLYDLPSISDETETYRKWLGKIHQFVVKKATVAIEMESGLPIFWRGEACL